MPENTIIYQITVPLDQWPTYPALEMKQATSGNIIHLTATSQGQPVTFPEGTTGEFRAKKGDNTYIDRMEGVTVSGQLTTIEITANTLAAEGEITCDVIFANAGTTLGVANFTINVLSGAIPQSIVESQNDWQSLAQAAAAATYAAEQAQNSAAQAEESASQAQGYSSHPPEILSNGNWGLWNGTTYEDSGSPSHGEDGRVYEIHAGTNITVDNTDPANPIINATGGGAVDSVVAGSNISVDNSNPASPVVSATGLMQTSTYDPAGYSRQLAAETYSTLTTTDKTVPGAINELNAAIASAGATQILLNPVVSTTQPQSPSDLTCWIDSDISMTNWYYGPLTNTVPSQGLLCIQDSGNIVLPITNTAHQMESLGSAFMYNSGAWASVPIQVYYNGSWIALDKLLFDNGTTEYTFSGGAISGSASSGTKTANVSGNNLFVGISGALNNTWSGAYLSTTEAIDVTGYNKLVVEYYSAQNLDTNLTKIGLALLTSQAATGTTSATLTNAAKYTSASPTSFAAGSTFELDISGASGSYYPALILWSSSNNNVQTYYSKMRLEA